ncbi:MAG: hypothetical protein U0736_17665 [Gemmataceae bacterium]
MPALNLMTPLSTLMPVVLFSIRLAERGAGRGVHRDTDTADVGDLQHVADRRAGAGDDHPAVEQLAGGAAGQAGAVPARTTSLPVPDRVPVRLSVRR